jgi:hypothetical protein
MRKCAGNNTREWGFDSIFNVECPACGKSMEFFQDEINRHCPQCRETVTNPRKDYGCGQWCSASSPHRRNLYSKFIRSKQRYFGNYL